MKRIVICPIFCESHFIKYQIPNIIDTINPDIIIYNEGLFPGATESKKDLNKQWLDKYTLDGKRGFDYLELEKIIKESQSLYPNVKIILNKMDYNSNMNSIDCYINATTNFEDLGIKIEEGDCIFPFEGDVFHHENSKDEITGYINQLEPNQGFKTHWLEFVANQFYVEKKTLMEFHQSRKICIKFGTMDFYKQVLGNFITQNYDMLFPTELMTYHYAWWRPGKFLDLRCDQLERHPGYWENFRVAIDIANELKLEEINNRPSISTNPDNINVWIKKINIEHPKHIKEHPCYINL
tara:strand:+ start:255 stop:1139 length:885 start_codon:yes stop_codon:yes gene_type:complete